MTMLEIATNMWPLWLFGIFMMFMTYKSGHGDLLKIDKKCVKKWTIFIAILSLYRYLVLRYTGVQQDMSGALTIPWQAALTVSWEDACHGLPLVLIERFTNKLKYGKLLLLPAIALVTASFGLGHVYQGLGAAAALSLYVPYTFWAGKKYGFGTVMICHVLYDLATLGLLHWMFGG